MGGLGCGCKAMKRLMDVLLTSVGLLCLLPVLIVLGLLVRKKLGSPILFVQTRPGHQGRPFNMCKFRTMTDERDESGQLLPDHIRLTSFGRFLRSTSLDELPELWNVLKGDMSLVGPRPLLMEYLPMYNDKQKRRHEVRPGVTGWAQINGRNSISWDQKFDLDVWYVNNRNILLDVKIIFLTILKVFKRSDISHEGEVTMHRFQGNGDGHKQE